jgi:hypothetical protein
MKRIIAAALALTVVVSMVSCKPSAPAETTEKDSTATAETVQPVDSAAHQPDSTTTAPADSAAAH